MSHLYGFPPDTFDEQWSLEADRRVCRPFKDKKGRIISEFMTEFATKDSYRRLLKRGAISVKNFFSRATGQNQSDEAIAVHLGVPRERIDRWRNKQSGRIDPLLYFTVFISTEPNALGDWTQGLASECVLACIREVSQLSSPADRPPSMPSLLAVRFMAHCFRQPSSHYRLFLAKDGRVDALAEYLHGFFQKNESLVRTHKSELAGALTTYGYSVFAVLHNLPARALSDVLGR